MLVHLMSDLIKDKTLKLEFSQTPIAVFERYGIMDFESLNSNGIEALIDRISSEIKESLELPHMLGWPSPEEIKVTNVTPDKKSVSEYIGEIEIHGTNFNSLKKGSINKIEFRNSSDSISTIDFKISSDKLIQANFNGSLNSGDYDLIAYLNDEKLGYSVLKNAFIVE
jgi:hypothetical protein